MSKIEYVSKRFRQTSQVIIDQANEILEEYTDQGFVLTLRQLYYQFVARDLLPNTQKAYGQLGTIMNGARLAGLVDWDYLIDRTRNMQSLEHFEDASDALNKLASWYHVDFWKDQEYRPEVWIEKDALIGVIEGVCNDLDVPYFSCRGYTSQSEMWRAAMRLQSYNRRGQTPVILHFGDHDPSGKDMTRDIVDRIELFTDDNMKVDRLALNMDQIDEYGPPPNPAKITDTRASAYIAEFGDESWELDALEPSVIAALIRDYIEDLRDDKIWRQTEDEKEVVRDRLVEIAKQFS